MVAIADIRKDYTQSALDISAAHADPISQFDIWFNEALKAEVLEPNAMSVSTLSTQNRPASRILLLKGYDQKGFVWFTNYESRKGVELAASPYAALLFFWPELERQVRIEGVVEKTSTEESDTYYNSRPLMSRLGAHVSQQSQILESRDQLERSFEDVKARYGENPPRPEHWGGYRLKPELIEFWQGRPSRLHDRLLYNLKENSWHRSCLQP
jgi:pyridoxamine 5'-phosphate oxidase